MTNSDAALLAAHQAARQSKLRPGDKEYAEMLDRVEREMVRVGDHTSERRHNDK